MKDKIKDIYKCEKLKGNDPLVLWHNQVIEKREEQLTVSDVARCIRQNLFMECAGEMMLAYLLHNPYAGDAYCGELMDKAGEMDSKYLLKHKDTILEIIDKAYEFIDENKWECEEEKSEFLESVDRLHELVK